MGKMQRNKGAGGEREWCEQLKAYGLGDAKRLLGQARDGGGDVAMPPLLYEVKRRKGIASRKWLDQAEAAVVSYTGRPRCSVPVVAMREDGRTEWMVLMRASDFAALVKQELFKLLT